MKYILVVTKYRKKHDIMGHEYVHAHMMIS